MSIFKKPYASSKGYHVTPNLNWKELEDFIESFANDNNALILQVLSTGAVCRVVYRIN